jgi:hypothetical protein
VQLAQYQPPQMRSMRDVVRMIPPGVRQIIATKEPEAAIDYILKNYVEPGHEAVWHAPSGQVVYAPKSQILSDPSLQPIEGQKLSMDRQRLEIEQDKARRQAANDKISVGPDGKPTPNETMLSYEQRIKAIEDQFKQAEERRKKEAGQSEQNFNQEKAIRNEFETQPAVKSYRTVVPMLESAKDAAARPTRAADLNLVYAFAKLMDPDSVVRESETGVVNATASVADRLSGYISQLNGQAMLLPETRKKLITELDSRLHSLKESHDVLASQYADIAKAYNLDPGRVVIPIRAPGRSGGESNQPTQEELRGWSSGAKTGGVRLQYIPGRGTVPQ